MKSIHTSQSIIMETPIRLALDNADPELLDQGRPIQEQLQELAQSSGPAQKFQETIAALERTEAEEGDAFSRGMSSRKAKELTMIVGFVMFIYSLTKRERDDAHERSAAEIEKLKAETERLRAETRAMSGSPASPLVEQAAEAVLFIERERAAQLQEQIQTAAHKSLVDDGVPESESKGLVAGFLVYVDGSGTLIIDIPQALRDRVLVLQKEGKGAAFREMIASSVLRAEFRPTDTSDRERFDALLTALRIPQQSA
jgi:hypothetical protein